MHRECSTGDANHDSEQTQTRRNERTNLMMVIAVVVEVVVILNIVN